MISPHVYLLLCIYFTWALLCFYYILMEITLAFKLSATLSLGFNYGKMVYTVSKQIIDTHWTSANGSTWKRAFPDDKCLNKLMWEKVRAVGVLVGMLDDKWGGVGGTGFKIPTIPEVSWLTSCSSLIQAIDSFNMESRNLIWSWLVRYSALLIWWKGSWGSLTLGPKCIPLQSLESLLICAIDTIDVDRCVNQNM